MLQLLKIKLAMMRLGSHSLVLPLPQCPTQLLFKTHFSYFVKRGRNKEQTHVDLSQSGFSCFGRKQSVVERAKFFTAVGNCLTSNSKGRQKILEEITEDDENTEQKADRNANTILGPRNEETKMQNIVDTSVLKEDNLDLFWQLSDGNLSTFNALRSWQMKINVLSKIYGVTPKINEENWMSLLTNSKLLNLRFLSYIFGVGLKQEKMKTQIQLPLPDVIEEDMSNVVYDDPMCYHLFHNFMFIKFSDKYMKKLSYARAMASVLHGPEIFIDCSYNDFMTHVESKYMSKQIVDSVKRNIMNEEPFHIILCNFNRNSESGKWLSKYSPLFYEDYHPVTATTKSYLDFYPKNKFIYLTPHCSKIMTEYDPNKRYIIGGFVDKTKPQHVSVAKAKENNIEMAKLPIDKYVEWHQGKKSLCINHVVDILLSIKLDNDWRKALEIIPKRFLQKPVVKRKKVSKICETVKLINSLENMKYV